MTKKLLKSIPSDRIRVYISGPITKGDRNYNAYRAFSLQKRMMQDGMAPLNPVASCCFPFAWEEDMDHDLWLECDLPWIEAADAVIRIEGESDGADVECAFAKTRGIPVFAYYRELEEWAVEFRKTITEESSPSLPGGTIWSRLKRFARWRSA